MRLRKDLPTTSRTLETQKAYNTYLAPLFPEYLLLSQRAIALPTGLISRLNENLKTINRPSSRLKDFLAQESHGLLITDMSPPQSTRLIEFKPKWLLQSPSAPSRAYKCRTCALRQRRQALKIKTAHISKQPSGPPGYCPLDIVSHDTEDIKRAAWRILFPKAADASRAISPADDVLWERFLRFLKETDILKILRNAQRSFDGSDALFRDGLGEDCSRKLRMAYTLRDCSIFVLIPEDKNKGIVAKVGDLDLKSEAKIGKWREMERELIHEGWYVNTDSMGCALETLKKQR